MASEDVIALIFDSQRKFLHQSPRGGGEDACEDPSVASNEEAQDESVRELEDRYTYNQPDDYEQLREQELQYFDNQASEDHGFK